MCNFIHDLTTIRCLAYRSAHATSHATGHFCSRPAPSPAQCPHRNSTLSKNSVCRLYNTEISLSFPLPQRLKQAKEALVSRLRCSILQGAVVTSEALCTSASCPCLRSTHFYASPHLPLSSVPVRRHIPANDR